MAKKDIADFIIKANPTTDDYMTGVGNNRIGFKTPYKTPITPPSGADLSSQQAAFGQSARNGTASTFARSDHYHALPAMPVSGELDTSTTYIDEIRYRWRGGFVYLQFGASNVSSIILYPQSPFTIPTEIRPLFTIDFISLYVNLSNNINYPVRSRLNTNGMVTLYNDGITSAYSNILIGSIVYPI